MKRLIIGDIHGCYAELLELVEKAALSSDDEIIALGDIVDRGPDSPEVLNFFRLRATASSLMGNHERKHIRSFKGETRPARSQIITRHQFGADRYPAAIGFIETFPLVREFPEAIVVHAFFEPDAPVTEQKEMVVVGTLAGEAYLERTYDRPWYELYTSDKPLIVGHHDYLGNGKPFIYRDRVFCIDTACCHGKNLTGLVLPDFRIVSVKSHKDHWRELRKKFM